MSCHGLVLGNVRNQSVPLEEVNEHVYSALDPLYIPRYHHSIDGIKHPQTLPHHKYQPLMGNQFFLRRQQNPIPHHIVNNNIKEGGLYETSLGCPCSHLEVGAVVPLLMGNDHLPLPNFRQDPAHV